MWQELCKQHVMLASVIEMRADMILFLQGGLRTRKVYAAAPTEQLWENYFPGAPAIQARYKQVKDLVEARNTRMGRPNPANLVGSKSMADPYVFCKRSFPPVSDTDQDEFHECLVSLGVKARDVPDVGDSQVATDIAGSPAGRHAPDGAGALSPGSDGWSRW